MKTTKVKKQNRPTAMDTTNAARYLGVSESLLRKLRQNGEGPKFCRISNKKIVYRAVDLKRFVKNCIIEQRGSSMKNEIQISPDFENIPDGLKKHPRWEKLGGAVDYKYSDLLDYINEQSI